MNVSKLHWIAALGWAGALVLLAISLWGDELQGWAWDPASAGAGSHLDEARALEIASDWASTQLKATLGSSHGNADGTTSGAVTADGGVVQFQDFERVSLQFVADTRQMVTAIDSGVGFEEEKDFWIVAWERGGVDNVTTGKPDGTAYVEVIVEDVTGKVLASGIGVRQPELQAKARGTLPSWDELFGDAPLIIKDRSR